MPSPAQMALAVRRAASLAAPPAPPPLLALTNFYGGAGYNTLAAGGEAGVSTGFGTITFGRPRVVPTNTGVFRSKISSTGWQQLYSPSGFSCNYHNGSSGFIAGPYQSIAPSDVGRAMVFVTRITATPGVLEQSLNMVWHNTTPAMSGYSAAATAESLGNNNTAGYPSSDFDITATVDFRGTPTRAQIDAYILAARALGDLPTTFAGATITYRWSLPAALASTTVVHGQAAPTTLVDTVAGVAASTMTKTGSPTVRRTEASVNGRKSNALMNATVGSAYRSAVGTGPRGSAAGHWAAMVATLRTSASGATEILMDVSGSTDGYRIARIAGTDRLEIYCYGAVNITSGVANIVANDREIPQVVLYTYDGTTHSIRLARGVVISGAGSYVVPGAGARRTTLLGDRDLTASAPNTEMFAAAAGDVALTTPEIDAIFATFDSTRTLVTPAAKTSWSADLTLDVTANGGAEAGAPATLADRVAAAAPLTRNGSSLIVTRRTDRLYGLEATPVMRGFTPLSTAHYQTAAALADIGNVASWWYVIARQDNQLAPSTQLLLSSNPSGSAGVTIFAGTTYVTAAISGASGATFSSSGNVSLPAGDVGKVDVFLGVYTGSNIQLYRKRVLGLSAAAAVTPAVSTSPLFIGSENNAGPRIASSWTIFGGGAGLGVPTLAQYQALYDWILSEDGQAQPMPGLATAHVWRVPAASAWPSTVTDVGTAPNNLTRIGAPTDVPNYVRAMAA